MDAFAGVQSQFLNDSGASETKQGLFG